MKITLFIIIIISIAYFGLSGFVLLKRYKSIVKIDCAINFMLNKRFKCVESIISELKNPASFEETSISEIVYLRSQALKFQKEGDTRAEHLCENKISYLLSALNIIMEESPNLKDIPQKQKILEDIVKMESHLNELKLKYNRLVERYNIDRSSTINFPYIKLFKKLNTEFNDWS